jgi:short stature homeobox protein
LSSNKNNNKNNNKITMMRIGIYFQYAAAAAAMSSSSSPLVFCHPQYPLGLAALAAVHQDRLHSKNSSIADLRLKAKKHAEALGLTTREKAV